MDKKKAMQTLETQLMKFLKTLVRVSVIDCLDNYVWKPLGEMDIVKDTEKCSAQWGNNLERMDGKKKKKKQSLYRPGQTQRFPGVWGSQISRQTAPEICKVVSPTHRPPLPPRKYSWYSFLLESESTQGHSVAGRIKSMKNSNDTIGNLIRDLPACSAVTHPTAPRRVLWIEAHDLIRRGFYYRARKKQKLHDQIKDGPNSCDFGTGPSGFVLIEL